MSCCDYGFKSIRNKDWLDTLKKKMFQFWFDIAFEWQYLSETVPINLEQVKNTFKDINKMFNLFWSTLRWSFVGLVWVWIGRRIEIGGQYLQSGWTNKIVRKCLMRSIFKAWDVPLAINHRHSNNKNGPTFIFCIVIVPLGTMLGTMAG